MSDLNKQQTGILLSQPREETDPFSRLNHVKRQLEQTRSQYTSPLVILDHKGRDITPEVEKRIYSKEIERINNYLNITRQTISPEPVGPIAPHGTGLTMTGKFAPRTAEEKEADKQIAWMVKAEMAMSDSTKTSGRLWDIPRVLFSTGDTGGRGGLAAVARLMDPSGDVWKAPALIDGEEDTPLKWLGRWLKTFGRAVPLGMRHQDLLDLHGRAVRTEDKVVNAPLLRKEVQGKDIWDVLSELKGGSLAQGLGFLRGWGDASAADNVLRAREAEKLNPGEAKTQNIIRIRAFLSQELGVIGAMAWDMGGDIPRGLIDKAKEVQQEIKNLDKLIPNYGHGAMWDGTISIGEGVRYFFTEQAPRFLQNIGAVAKLIDKIPDEIISDTDKAIAISSFIVGVPSIALTGLTTAVAGMMGKNTAVQQYAEIISQEVRYPIFADDIEKAIEKGVDGWTVFSVVEDRRLPFIPEPGIYNGKEVLGWAKSAMPHPLALRQALLVGASEAIIEAVQLRLGATGRGLIPAMKKVIQTANAKMLQKHGLTKILMSWAGEIILETGYQVGTEALQEAAQYLIKMYSEELSNIVGNTSYADSSGQLKEIIIKTIDQSVVGLGIASLPGRSIQAVMQVTSHQGKVNLDRRNEREIAELNARFPQPAVPLGDKVNTAIDEQRSKLEKQVGDIIPRQHQEEVLSRIEDGDLTAKEKGQEWERQWNEAEQTVRDKITAGQKELKSLQQAKETIAKQIDVANARSREARNEPLAKEIEEQSRIQQRYFDEEVGNLSEQNREAVYIQALENKIKLHEQVLEDGKANNELSSAYVVEVTDKIKKWKEQLSEDIKLIGNKDESIYRVEGDKNAPVITLTREGKGAKTLWVVSAEKDGVKVKPQTFGTAHEAIASITGNAPVNGMLSYQTSMATIVGSLGYTRVGAKITTQEQRTKAIITVDPQETFEALTTAQQEGQTAITKRIDKVTVANASIGRAVIREPAPVKGFSIRELTEGDWTINKLKDQLTDLAKGKMPNFNTNDSKSVLIEKLAKAKTPKPATIGQYITGRGRDSAIRNVRDSLDASLVEEQVSSVLKKRVANVHRNLAKQIRRLRDQGNLHDTSAYVAELEFFLGQLDRIQNTTDPQPEIDSAYSRTLQHARSTVNMPGWASKAKDTLDELRKSHKAIQEAMGTDVYRGITLPQAEAVANLFILMSQSDLNANTVYFNRKPQSLDKVVTEVIAGMDLPEWLGDREVSKMNKGQITKKITEIVALSTSGQAYIDMFFPKGSAANQIFLLSQSTSRQKSTFRKLINTLKGYRKGLPNADMGSKKLQAYFNELKDQYKLNTGIKTSDGNDLVVSLTRGEVMALYMHLQSPDNARHITEGGFSLRDRPEDIILLEGEQIEIARQDAIGEIEIDSTLDEKQQNNAIKRVNDGKRDGEFRKKVLTEFVENALDPNDMNELEAVRKFYHNQYEMVNKVFRVRQGRPLPRVLNYFNIRTIKKARKAEDIKLDRDESLQPPRDVRIDMSQMNHLPISFTLDRVNSKVPVHLDTLPNAVSKGAEDASVYVGLSQQMGDATKIFEKIKQSMSEKYGSEVTDMFEQRLDDIVREVHPMGFIDKFARTMIQNVKTAYLSLNPSVAIIQGASYTAAAAYVNESLLLDIRGSKDGTSRAQWKDFFTERSGIYSDRVLGYISRDIAPALGARQRDTTVFTGKIDKNLIEKTLWGIHAMDLVTVHNIMVAAFKEAEGFIETNNFNAKNGQLLEFTGVDANTISQLKEQGDWNTLTELMVRYAETVIERTQPMFDPSQRSALSRTKNPIIMGVTAFRGWSDASFRTAMIEMRRGLRGEPGSGLRITKWFISNILIGSLALYMIHGARTAFRNMITGREDEPESYWNKILDSTFGAIPFLREVWGSAEGFIKDNGLARGVSVGFGMAGIADTVDLINALKLMLEAEEGSEAQRRHAERAIIEGLHAFALLSGYPYIIHWPARAILARTGE